MYILFHTLTLYNIIQKSKGSNTCAQILLPGLVTLVYE